jgi:hypothetical protein
MLCVTEHPALRASLRFSHCWYTFFGTQCPMLMPVSPTQRLLLLSSLSLSVRLRTSFSASFSLLVHILRHSVSDADAGVPHPTASSLYPFLCICVPTSSVLLWGLPCFLVCPHLIHFHVTHFLPYCSRRPLLTSLLRCFFFLSLVFSSFRFHFP